jgi:hypothetical protein
MANILKSKQHNNNDERYFMALEQSSISHYRCYLMKKYLKKWKVIKNNIIDGRRIFCERLAIYSLRQRTKYSFKEYIKFFEECSQRG